MNTFEFIVLAALRAKQLARGATARVDGNHKLFITAQLEVLAGKVQKIDDSAPAVYPDVSMLRARPAHAAIGRRL